MDNDTLRTGYLRFMGWYTNQVVRSGGLLVKPRQITMGEREVPTKNHVVFFLAETVERPGK